MSTIEWDPKAKKSLARLAKQDPGGTDQVLDSINLLARNPRPAGAQPYGASLLRMRVGFYRVVYEIVREKPLIISIEHVGRSRTP
ncbi:type II toxin-antitoxin system RelE family toxin [Streptomyces sp. MS19]|uniref:type II toxin-antitoxin system RelE family toxin n=1 Tax=Streptomyces sp. MS19 TaxID=3385972 RepID=UPI0039A368B7